MKRNKWLAMIILGMLLIAMLPMAVHAEENPGIVSGTDSIQAPESTDNLSESVKSIVWMGTFQGDDDTESKPVPWYVS